MGIENKHINWTLSAVDRASATFKSVESEMGKLSAAWGLIKTTLGVGFVTVGLSKIVEQAKEAEQSANRLNAVLRNTGAAAGFTSREVEGMADALAESTQFDDESIKKAAAEILIFGKIHGATFKEVLKLSTDVAAFWGTDLPSAAKDVAKALADPESAFKLLKSAGVTLSDQQKDQLKHMGALGDEAGQQKIILDELQKAYRGTAEMMNQGFTKATGGATKAWNEMLEALGKTRAVQSTVTGSLGILEESMKQVKEIVENGDWIEKLLATAAFSVGFTGMRLSRPPPRPPSWEEQYAEQQRRLQAMLPGLSDADYALAKRQRFVAFGNSQIALSENLNVLAQEQKLLDDSHSEGLVSEDNYYRRRRDMIDDRLRSELEAVKAGIAAQNALWEVGATPEALAAATLEMSKLNAQREKVILGADVDKELLDRQKRRGGQALREEVSKAEQVHILALNEARERQMDIRVEASQVDRDALSDMGFEIELIGKTAVEIEKMNEVRKIDLKLRQDLRAASLADPSGETQAFQDTVDFLHTRAAQQKKDVLDSVTYRLQLERDWVTGANAAFNEYIDHASNAAEQSRNAFSHFLNNTEDELTNFVTKGKLDFEGLADSVVSDLTRMAIKAEITGPLAASMKANGGVWGLISSLFGGGKSIGGDWTGYMATASAGGFASGGTFKVPGSGGTDTTRVQFMATPGERVTVQTPAQQRTGGDRRPEITVHNTNVFNLSGPVDRSTQAQIAAAAGAGVQRAMRRNN